MLKQSKWSQYGKEGLDVKGITIHNTNSPLSAKELFSYLENECELPTGCHYLVDESEVIEVMPLNWCTYHTGKGEDVGFRKTIAIEICNSQDDEKTYMKAQDKAIKLIAELMRRYDLNIEDIYFHIDFNNQYYCPHRILQIYKTKENFIKEVF